MNITWYDKNNDSFALETTSNCQLTNKMLSNENDETKECINIVFGQESYLNSFFNCLKGMQNNFDGLNFRIGVVNKVSKIEFMEANIIESSVIYIGGNEEEEKYLSVFNESANLIANRCQGKYKTIGFQRHLTNEIHPLSISLSELRKDFSLAESSLRAAKAIFFNKSSVRVQESNSSYSRITGLDIYECCQLLRYCGLSTEHDFLFINGEEKQNNNDIWDMITTVVWYYLEGRTFKTIDDSTDNINTYLVESPLFKDAITFYKSEKTNRWWFLSPENGKKVPCSENDYLNLSKGDFPDILLSHSVIQS
ncbi:MAG: hypothetical protein HKO66_14165 [Saprospiraceae bacterium]|nr:hypothetical protein [Bacteroidia bacterium]NNE14911.1 hypothetical protein [Saprospiraceae bacterium]NNL93382.1 hypothetical protein [Saprospiraceae bacterium]